MEAWLEVELVLDEDQKPEIEHPESNRNNVNSKSPAIEHPAPAGQMAPLPQPIPPPTSAPPPPIKREEEAVKKSMKRKEAV